MKKRIGVEPFPENKAVQEIKSIEPVKPKLKPAAPCEAVGEEKHTDEMTDPVEYVKRRIAQAFRCVSGSPAEFYPFDSMTLENIEGMRRAYQDILQFISKEPVPSSESQYKLWIDIWDLAQEAMEKNLGVKDTVKTFSDRYTIHRKQQ